MANDKAFQIKNGLVVGNTSIINSSGVWIGTPPTKDTFTFGGSGVPVTGNAMTSYVRVMSNCVCVSASLILKTAPTGGNCVMRIMRSSNSGNTFPDNVVDLNAVAGTKIGTNNTTVVLTTGDFLRLDITAVNTASDWTVQLHTTGAL